MRKLIFFFLFSFFSFLSQAQCAMCRAQLESMEDNSVAEGVNNGIVFLMVIPYILLAIIAIAIYRSFKKKKVN